jgi:hypothetical protein
MCGVDNFTHPDGRPGGLIVNQVLFAGMAALRAKRTFDPICTSQKDQRATSDMKEAACWGGLASAVAIAVN